MFVKNLLVAATLLALMVLPAAAQDASSPTPPPPIPINITMTDYNFVVEGLAANQPLELHVGQPYEIHFKNTSATQMPHEVLMGKDAMTLKGGFKHDYSTPMLDDVEVELSGEMNGHEFLVGAAGLNEFELPVGGEITISFTLPDEKVGEWEMGCFEFLSMDNTVDNPGPTHYDAGMHLAISVKPAAAT
jgi:hypothetical protein